MKYCNKKGINFLAYNTGHGSTVTLSRFDGVQISLSNLQQITIQPDGNSVWVQGGSRAGPVNRFLWDKGYVTTTGACDCVGMAGSALGGGRGRLQGLYGLVSDSIRQLNVVLADGSHIRVNASSYADLFWALRGAGHNFGIITSMEMSLYPQGPSTWHYKNYLWSSDKLNQVFTAINTLHGTYKNGTDTTPVNMANDNGMFLYEAAIDAKRPLISWQFSFRGSAADAARYLAPFDAIPAVSSDSGDLPYPDIAHAQSVGEDDVACSGSLARLITTAGLRTFNLTAEQLIVDSFSKRIAEHPQLAPLTFIIHEGYPTQGITDKNPADSAFPFRADAHLMQFQGNLAVNASCQDQQLMSQWADEVVNIWNTGEPGRLPDAYVNYASGHEPVQQWYGHEPWRIERLRGLKAKYDPTNQFRFYNPII